VPPTRTVTDAADAFLARATAPTTRRSYGQTMSALTAAYGDRPLDALDGAAVAELAAHSWGTLAPATWNRHLAGAPVPPRGRPRPIISFPSKVGNGSDGLLMRGSKPDASDNVESRTRKRQPVRHDGAAPAPASAWGLLDLDYQGLSR